MTTIDRRYVVETPMAEIADNVMSFLRWLRHERPVAYVADLNAWVLTRWDDVHAVLQSPQQFRGKPTYLYMPALGGEYLSSVGDGDAHECLRRGVDASLAPRSIESWAGAVIDPAIDTQLDSVFDAGTADLLDDVMGPISMTVALHVLGLEDLPVAVAWRWYTGLAAGLTNFEANPLQQDRSWALSREIDEYCRPLLEARSRRQDDTMMYHLLRHAKGESFGERMSFVMPTLKAALFAGAQEPAHATVNTLLGILGDESSRQRFLEDPAGLVVQATEEGLRWMPPLTCFLRRVVSEASVRGVTLPEGSEMMVSLASANRDEAVWGEHADAFDLDRFAPESTAHHVSFGLHPHFCPGNWLVRTTVHRALVRVVNRLRNLRIDVGRPSTGGHGVLINAPHLHCDWDTQ